MKPESLDALIILGGETEEQTRSNTALHLYEDVMKRRSEPLLLIPAGGASNGGPTEAERMQDYFRRQGVPLTHICIENDSKDTYANLVLSTEILEFVEASTFGIVTDPFHRWRTTRLNRRIQRSQENWDVFVSERPTTMKQRVTEAITYAALARDLNRYGIENGNVQDHKYFLSDVHPLHAKDSPPGWYKALCDLSGTTR